MKLFLLMLFMLLNILNADTAAKMYQLYEKGEYIASCNLGLQHFKEFESNENYVSLYAFSCLKADQIDRLNTPLMRLSQSIEARANASYFSMLVMQKKLLVQALYDNLSLKSLKFPTSSHLLSKIFTLYCNNPQTENTIKVYSDLANNRITYKLYPILSNGRKTIAIDEYYDKILTLHHVY
ncbi:MAG: hypothetical protein V2A75_11545 [Pseudomonadota bacterium]